MKYGDRQVEYSEDRKTVNLKFKCPLCGLAHSLNDIDAKSYEKYLDRELVQRAFPKMNATDREKIMTGMCEACQIKIFGE